MARKLDGCREGEGVPAHREHACGDEHRDEHSERCLGQSRGEGDEDRRAERDAPQRPDPAGRQIRPAAGGDPPSDREQLRDRKNGGRGAGREPVLLMQVDDGEPADAQLRREHEGAAGRECPQPPVAEGARPVRRRGSFSDPALAEDDSAHERSAQARQPHRREAPPDAASSDGVWQRDRDREAGEWDRGLPDAEGETALFGREPVEDGAPARRVHTGAERAGETEERKERPEALHARRAEQRQPARADAGHQHQPFADAVGCETPRDQGEDRTDERRGDEEARLAQREVQLASEGRRHDRDAEPDRRVGRLRERPGGEHRPSVVAQRPNGLVGRVPVYVTTDFVSR